MKEGWFEMKEYSVGLYDDNEGDKTIWIQNADGEGMGVSVEKFEKLINEFFEKEF